MKKTKRTFTLMEMMIVIALIGIIGSIIGFSMRGSLDEGKAFKTEQAMQKLEDILELELAKGKTWEEFEKNRQQFVQSAGLIKNPNDVLRDGWGNDLQVTRDDAGQLSIQSAKLDAFKLRKASK